MTRRFFSKINYSASNEDTAAELAALKLNRADHVLCVTGSGARGLDLLTADPQRIVCVDFNPTQNHLLNLKIAAYRLLEYEDFLIFMGIVPSAHPDLHFDSVIKSLNAQSNAYWRDRRSLVQRGLIYCGTWEKLLRAMSKMTVFRQKHIDGLLNAEALSAQQDYWEKFWTGPFLRRVLNIIATRWVWTTIIREPGAKIIPRDFNVAEYLFQSLQSMARRTLLRENPFANLIFYGRYTSDCILPLHLQEANFDSIKQRVDRLDVVTAPLHEYLFNNPAVFDAFSLSDFSSYASPSLYQEIYSSVRYSAKDKARFCERFFLVKRDREDWNLPVIESIELANHLEQLDHTCMYTFRAGHVIAAQ